MAPLPAVGARLSLSRAQRIRKRREFVRIQESEHSARVTTRSLLMLLSLRDNADEGPPRLGVVASRKVGPAVARNRAKRLVREAFRRHPDVFPPRLDVVIVIRPGTHRLAQADLDEQVRRARPALERRAAELSDGRRAAEFSDGRRAAEFSDGRRAAEFSDGRRAASFTDRNALRTGGRGNDGDGPDETRDLGRDRLRRR